jgi:glycosyltransferase involved in cell wall biosynthesis
MKIAIITSRYPSEENHYAHTFVHARARYLKSKGIDVTVFVPSKKYSNYEFDSVKVELMPAYNISKVILNYDLCYLHLLNIYATPCFNGAFIYQSILKNKLKVCFYLHGSEVQKYTTRLFDFKFNLREFARIIYKDFYFIPVMKFFISRLIHADLIHFFSPSKWMVKEAELNLNVQIDKYEIIPNGIDIKRFISVERGKDIRFKALIVRPLNSQKYAVDICIKTLKHLPKFTLDIYGKGPLLQQYKALATHLHVADRIKFIEEFIPNSEMAKVFHQYGVYLSPTRMDAQGVSMCEAMATGMLVASSHNTAVPEFIIDGENGILGTTPKEIASKILSAVTDDNKYSQICRNAEKSMTMIDNDVVMKKELLFLREFASLNRDGC